MLGVGVPEKYLKMWVHKKCPSGNIETVPINGGGGGGGGEAVDNKMG